MAQDGKESTCNAGALVLIPVLGRSPGEGNAPIFSSGELHGQRSLAGYSPWDSKELDMTEQSTLHFSLAGCKDTLKCKKAWPYKLMQI